jgi:hypothetical protein
MKTIVCALVAMAALVGIAGTALAASDGWTPQGFWQEEQDRLP